MKPKERVEGGSLPRTSTRSDHSVSRAVQQLPQE